MNIKPCPFCGSPGELHYSSDHEIVNVRCMSWGPSTCLGAGQNCHDEGKAIHAWNRRAARPEVVAPIPGDHPAGTYAAGWNDALERSFPKVEKMARGTGGRMYVKGFNACLDAVRSPLAAPAAWVATKGDKVLHLAKADGWRVEVVQTEPQKSGQE